MVRMIYLCIGFSCFSAEILVFTALLITLVYEKLKGAGQIGKLPILVVVLCIFNGIFGAFRINAMFPRDKKLNFSQITAFFGLEQISFYGALWFFSIKFYEAAKDIENLFSDDQKVSKMTKTRKVNFLIFRWIIFFCIIGANVVLAVCTTRLQNGMDDIICKVVWVCLGLVTVIIMLLLAVSLYKFVKVVKKLGGQGNINQSFIVVQILGLIIWIGSWTIEGIYFFRFVKGANEYKRILLILVFNSVTLVANLLNFIIIAVVVYKSSKVIQLNHDPALKEDVSLLAYLRSQCIAQEKANVSSE